MRAVLKPYIKSFGSNDCIQQGKLDYSDAVHRFKKQYKKVELMEQALQRISSARKIFMQKKEFLQNRKEKLRVLQEQQEQSAERLLKEIQEFAKQSKEAKELLKNYRTKYTDLQTEKSRQDEYEVELEGRIENILSANFGGRGTSQDLGYPLGVDSPADDAVPYYSRTVSSIGAGRAGITDGGNQGKSTAAGIEESKEHVQSTGTLDLQDG